MGLPDKAVAEARERVRAALSAMGLSLPPKRILINLAPADLQKEGSHFDLPIALGVLAAMEVLPKTEVAEYAALGELALNGALAPVNGVLPAAMAAVADGLGLVCPARQGAEAAWAGDIRILAAPDLVSLVNHFKGQQVLSPPAAGDAADETQQPDLADIRGMETARRALEIAACGSHHLLLIGPPGAGKSMLAARLPGLLPDLTPLESLEVSIVHSVAGTFAGRPQRRPPFREPHHSASAAAMAGGGCQLQQLVRANTNCRERRISVKGSPIAARLRVRASESQDLQRGAVSIGEWSSLGKPNRRSDMAMQGEDGSGRLSPSAGESGVDAQDLSFGCVLHRLVA